MIFEYAVVYLAGTNTAPLTLDASGAGGAASSDGPGGLSGPMLTRDLNSTPSQSPLIATTTLVPRGGSGVGVAVTRQGAAAVLSPLAPPAPPTGALLSAGRRTLMVRSHSADGAALLPLALLVPLTVRVTAARPEHPSASSLGVSACAGTAVARNRTTATIVAAVNITPAMMRLFRRWNREWTWVAIGYSMTASPFRDVPPQSFSVRVRLQVRSEHTVKCLPFRSLQRSCTSEGVAAPHRRPYST